MDLGERIRSARETIGMTQEQLAAAVDVSARTVGNWERGQAPRNKLGALERVLHTNLRNIDDGNSPPLRQASDTEIYAELARRSAAQQRRIDELTDTLRAVRGDTDA